MSKETYIHQKRPTKETHRLGADAQAAVHKCRRRPMYIKRDLYLAEETYKRDLQKRLLTCINTHV